MRHLAGKGFGAAVLLLGIGGFSRLQADMDVTHLTHGVLVHNKGLLMLHDKWKYTAPRSGDPAQDTAQLSSELEFGVTDRLSVGIGFVSTKGRRDALAANQLLADVHYLLPFDPLKMAPFAEALPSLRGGKPDWEFGVDSLKNFGPLGLFVNLKESVEHESDGSRHAVFEGEPGIVYRFGLHGLIGTKWEYHSTGEQHIHFLLGGSLSRHLFLGLEPVVGLTRQAPDFTLNVQLNALFGKSEIGHWGLD